MANNKRPRPGEGLDHAAWLAERNRRFDMVYAHLEKLMYAKKAAELAAQEAPVTAEDEVTQQE